MSWRWGMARRAARRSAPEHGPLGSQAAGQATVELVALIPIAVLVAAAVFHALAAGRASEAAGAAAEAGAVALLQDRDPGAAMRSALSGWPPESFDFRVEGRRVRVSVRPRGIRALSERLTARSVAHAGGSLSTYEPASVVRGGDGALGTTPRCPGRSRAWAGSLPI